MLLRTPALFFFVWKASAFNSTANYHDAELAPLDDDETPSHSGLVKRAFNPAGLPPQPSNRDCGTFRFNCEAGWAACNNACFYHYCIGNSNAEYRDLGVGGDTADWQLWNRIRSGQTINNGKLCRNLPISQRFYDMTPNWPTLTLQPDEWPMAAMIQGDFDPNSRIPRNTLRCIENGPNANAGGQYKQFRYGQGIWSNKNKNKAKYANTWIGQGPGRERSCTGQLQRGDRFKVLFDPAGLTPAQQQQLIPYCLAPDHGKCENDGFEFHLSGLQQTNAASNANSDGKMGWPYDPTAMNTYAMTDASRVTSPGLSQVDTLEMFNVVVERSGRGGETFAVVVSTYSGGRLLRISRRTSTLTSGAPGNTLTVPRSAQLPLPLTVKRTGTKLCNKVEFEYGDAATDGLQFFAFSTSDRGRADDGSAVGDGARKVFDADGNYCKSKRGKAADGSGTITWDCWFAGW